VQIPAYMPRESRESFFVSFMIHAQFCVYAQPWLDPYFKHLLYQFAYLQFYLSVFARIASLRERICPDNIASGFHRAHAA
jgi:hypothetical protein